MTATLQKADLWLTFQTLLREQETRVWVLIAVVGFVLLLSLVSNVGGRGTNDAVPPTSAKKHLVGRAKTMFQRATTCNGGNRCALAIGAAQAYLDALWQVSGPVIDQELLRDGGKFTADQMGAALRRQQKRVCHPS